MIEASIFMQSLRFLQEIRIKEITRAEQAAEIRGYLAAIREQKVVAHDTGDVLTVSEISAAEELLKNQLVKCI